MGPVKKSAGHGRVRSGQSEPGRRGNPVALGVSVFYDDVEGMFPAMIIIPYGTIGFGIALLVGIWAAILAETVKGRLFIVGTMVVLFLLRFVPLGRAGQIIGAVGWTVFGIGAIIFIKWKGVGIRG
jgi:hypothetical protein